MDVLVMTKRCREVMKLVMGLRHKSLKVMEFMMELHHRNSKKDEASVEALPYRFPHPYELISN